MLVKIQNPWHSGKHSKKKNHKICQKACRTLIVLIFDCLIFLILIFVLNLGLVLSCLKIELGFGLRINLKFEQFFVKVVPWLPLSFPSATLILSCVLEFLPWSPSSNLKMITWWHWGHIIWLILLFRLPGNSSLNLSFFKFSTPDCLANRFLTSWSHSIEPKVFDSSTIKEHRPVKIVPTDHAGFHVSGWKSDMDRLKRKHFNWNNEFEFLPKTLIHFESPIWCHH